MSAETCERECPCCRGTNLVDGKLMTHGRLSFVPAKRWMLSGYMVWAFVCSDCGFMGHYLDEADIQDLRRRQAKKNR